VHYFSKYAMESSSLLKLFVNTATRRPTPAQLMQAGGSHASANAEAVVGPIDDFCRFLAHTDSDAGLQSSTIKAVYVNDILFCDPEHEANAHSAEGAFSAYMTLDQTKRNHILKQRLRYLVERMPLSKKEYKVDLPSAQHVYWTALGHEKENILDHALSQMTSITVKKLEVVMDHILQLLVDHARQGYLSTSTDHEAWTDISNKLIKGLSGKPCNARLVSTLTDNFAQKYLTSEA
jgi:hypothetical protein